MVVIWLIRNKDLHALWQRSSTDNARDRERQTTQGISDRAFSYVHVDCAVGLSPTSPSIIC